MRRKDRQIKGLAEIETVIHDATVCRLGMSDGKMPYVVPLSFGYKDNTVYVHGALDGKKNKILQKNSHVCVEFDIDLGTIRHSKGCNWGVRYKSVIGFGNAIAISDAEEKRKALSIIMKQYSKESFTFSEESVSSVAVYKITLMRVTGKQCAR